MSSPVIAPNTEAAILGRLLEAREKMNREVAEFLLDLDFDQSDLDRMNLLSERAREVSRCTY